MGWTDEVHNHQTQVLTQGSPKKFKYVAHRAVSQHHRRRLSLHARGQSESLNRSTLLPVVTLTTSLVAALMFWRRGIRRLHRTSTHPLAQIGDFLRKTFTKNQTSNQSRDDKWKRMEPSAMAARAAVERAQVRNCAGSCWRNVIVYLLSV
jgi:hypothetical protein